MSFIKVIESILFFIFFLTMIQTGLSIGNYLYQIDEKIKRWIFVSSMNIATMLMLLLPATLVLTKHSQPYYAIAMHYQVILD